MSCFDFCIKRFYTTIQTLFSWTCDLFAVKQSGNIYHSHNILPRSMNCDCSFISCLLCSARSLWQMIQHLIMCVFRFVFNLNDIHIITKLHFSLLCDSCFDANNLRSVLLDRFCRLKFSLNSTHGKSFWKSFR